MADGIIERTSDIVAGLGMRCRHSRLLGDSLLQHQTAAKFHTLVRLCSPRVAPPCHKKAFQPVIT